MPKPRTRCSEGGDSGCNRDCKQGCKEITEGEGREFAPESANSEISKRIKNFDPGSCTTPPGTVRALSLPAGGLALRGGLAGISRGGGSAVLPLPGGARSGGV